PAPSPRHRLVRGGGHNPRRHTLETYCAVNGVAVERAIELDAMLATLDLVARSDWMAVLPGIMMALDDGAHHTVSPLDDPPLWLDLVLIEPSPRTLTAAAGSVLAAPAAASRRLKRRLAREGRAAPAAGTGDPAARAHPR